MEADFHGVYGVNNLQRELRGRTWRWFLVRLRALGADSAWSHALFPVDPATGERARREQVATIDDPDDVEAFFARGHG